MKMTFSILNNNDNNAAQYSLTMNRNIRNQNQNKCGPSSINNNGWSVVSRNQFIYRVKYDYNSLHRDLTLCNNAKLFKAWLTKYNSNKNNLIFKLPVRNINVRYLYTPIVDKDLVTECQDG